MSKPHHTLYVIVLRIRFIVMIAVMLVIAWSTYRSQSTFLLMASGAGAVLLLGAWVRFEYTERRKALQRAQQLSQAQDPDALNAQRARKKAWIDALLAFDTDENADVNCPQCTQGKMKWQDFVTPNGEAGERRIYCIQCGAENYALYRGEQVGKLQPERQSG